MALPVPPIALDATLVPFAIIAVAMVAITIFVFGKVLPPDGRPPLVSQMALALAVLGGGSLLLLSLVFVFVNPNGTAAWTWVLLAFNFMMMVPVGLWFVSVILFRDRRIRPHGWTWPTAVAVMTTGSEVFMGVLFAIGDSVSLPGFFASLAGGLISVWFFWSMASVMLALLLWAPLGRIERRALEALTAAAVVGPWVPTFPTIGGAAMGVLMAAIFAGLARRLLRDAVATEEVRLFLALGTAFLVTALAGLFVAVSDGSLLADLIFGGSMAVVLAAEVAFLFRRFYLGPPFPPWVRRGAAPGPPTEWSAGRGTPSLNR